MLIPPLPVLSAEYLSHQILLVTVLLIVTLSLSEIFGTDSHGHRGEVFVIFVPLIGILSLLVLYQIVSRFV